MEFTTIPPEVTSALIHSGPGAQSLIEASGAWEQLATSLEDSAAGYTSLLSSLTGVWHGASSSEMAQAVAPYLSWLRSTAQQCQQTAESAQVAAAAYTTVRSSVVSVAQVTANRTQLTRLLATNRFGSNLPAIAQTEDAYQAMWANNSAAMTRYQASSAQATTLTTFSSPPSITSATGTSAQAAASNTATAASSSSASSPADVLSTITSLIGFPDPNSGYYGLANTYANQFISSGFPINLLSYLAQNTQAQAFQGLGEIGKGLSEGEQALGAAEGDLAGAVRGIGSAGAAASAPQAATGVAVTVGRLSAPPAVVGLLPGQQIPVQLTSAATPMSAMDTGFPMLPMVPPPISAGSGWRKRKQPKYEDIQIGMELKGTVMPRPPSAG